MTFRKTGRVGRTGLDWATTLRRIVAADWLQMQRRVITVASYDCNADARPRSLSCLRAHLGYGLLEQSGNLRQRSSSMLLNLTPATHRQQP